MQGYQEGRLGALDGWRAISVAFVITGHLLGFSAIRSDLLGALASRLSLLGVYVFFCISGFVIVRGLKAQDRISIAGFYVRRAFRILPPLVFYLIGVWALVALGLIEAESLGATKSLLFICNIHAQCGGWFGGHTWSLSVEEQFYLAVPLILSLCLPTRWPLLFATLALPVVVIGLYLLNASQLATFLFPFQAIAWGAAAALWEKRVVAWVACLPPIALIVLATLVVAAWAIPHTAIATVIKILAMPPMVALLLRSSFCRERWSAFLSAPILKSVGVASYSIYLWQQVATYAYPGADISFYLVSVPATILLAMLLYEFVERPLIELGRAMSRSNSALGQRPAVEP